MRIQDIMSRKVVSIAPDTPVSVAREQMRLNEIDHLVVTSGKRIVGLVAGRDLNGADDAEPISSVMKRHVVSITPRATVRRAAGVMRGRAVGSLPVVENGRVVGIVTTSDLLTALSKGEIHAAPPRERYILRQRGPRKRLVPV